MYFLPINKFYPLIYFSSAEDTVPRSSLEYILLGLPKVGTATISKSFIKFRLWFHTFLSGMTLIPALCGKHTTLLGYFTGYPGGIQTHCCTTTNATLFTSMLDVPNG